MVQFAQIYAQIMHVITLETSRSLRLLQVPGNWALWSAQPLDSDHNDYEDFQQTQLFLANHAKFEVADLHATADLMTA